MCHGFCEAGQPLNGEAVERMCAHNALQLQDLADDIREAAAFRKIKGVFATVLFEDGSYEEIETAPGTADALDAIAAAEDLMHAEVARVAEAVAKVGVA